MGYGGKGDNIWVESLCGLYLKEKLHDLDQINTLKVIGYGVYNTCEHRVFLIPKLF